MAFWTMTNAGQSNCQECDDADATYIFSRTFLANFRPPPKCVRLHGPSLPFWPHTPPPPPLFAKQQSAGGVWRQQILNSIQRKSKLGREEIQPVTISVSMAFRGLACSAVKKDFSIGLNAPIPAFSLLPSHRDPSSSLLP